MSIADSPFLGSILLPYDLPAFVDRYLSRAPVLLREPARNFDHLLSIEAVSGMLNQLNLARSGLLQLVVGGQTIVPRSEAEVREKCRNGATLIIQMIDSVLANLGHCANELTASFGAAVMMNAYLSQADHQGFATHFDTHDVFVVQIEGYKRWRVFDSVERAPVYDGNREPWVSPTKEPLIEAVLQPGDVLYVPRGYAHDAVAHNTASLHLSVGLHAKTGLDVFGWFFGTLARVEEFREALPYGPLDSQETMVAWCAHVKDLRARVIERLDDLEDVVDDFRRAHVRSSIVRVKFSPQDLGGAPPQLDRTTRLIRRELLLIEETGDDVLITAPGKSLRFESDAITLLEEIARRRRFTPDDLLSAEGAFESSRMFAWLAQLLSNAMLEIE